MKERKPDKSKKLIATQPMGGISASLLGQGLEGALIARERCKEAGMTMEVGVFDTTVKEFKQKLEAEGLDPRAVIEERLRLLNNALIQED